MSWERCKKQNRIGKIEQLCWTCRNCIGRCSWSRDFIPIKGWDADMDTRTNADRSNSVTYRIYDCPEYQGEVV